MIVSKANLEVVNITKIDSKIPAIDNVYIAEDGSSIGIGGKMMLVVSPVKEEVKSKLKTVLKEEGKGGMSISSKTVRSILKSIPADRQFAGLLEHCNVERVEEDEGSVRVTMTDGRKQKTIIGRLSTCEFLPYKSLLKEAYDASKNNGINGTGKRLVLDLKRLLLLLSTIKKVASDTSGDSPVWIEFTDKDYIIIRSVNMITGQRCVGIMRPYNGVEGKWLELDEWEKSFVIEPKKKILNFKSKLKRRG